MNRVWTKWAGVVVFFLAAGAVTSARAAPPLSWVASQKPGPQAASRAENLVLRAVTLMQQKKWVRAARLLETSNQLDPAIGAHAHLAECYEALGRWALAWTTFTAAADHAGREGFADHAKAARIRAQHIEPRIVLLVLNVPQNASDTKGLRILVDGMDVDRQAWANGTEAVVAVDPGTHVLLATAPGKTSWQQTVRVPAAGSRIRVNVPAMVAVQEAIAQSRRSAERKAAIAAGSLGAVATATGVVGLILLSQDQPPAAVPVAISGFTVGVPGAITAIALAVGSPKRRVPANSTAIRFHISPKAGPKGASVVVTARF